MAESIAEPMEDNDALRYLVAEARAIDSILRQNNYEVDGGDEVAVPDATRTLLRNSNADAIKTVIVNTGEASADLYEDDVLVARVAAGETWTSPLAGKGLFEAEGAGDDTTLVLTTYAIPAS